VHGDGACAPHELATADNEGLTGDVGETELEEDVAEVCHIVVGLEHGDSCGEDDIHAQAGANNPHTMTLTWCATTDTGC
jgi:hypothetical protein